MAGPQPAPQRAWRAACPNCGAPVEFRSAASASAICSFCRSTLARDGETLRRVGTSAELFDDHSPLQLGATGRAQGVSFTLIGRLQHGYPDGTWNEWHVLFDNGRTAWLSEDNGAYVLSLEAELAGPAPTATGLSPGQRVRLGGGDWQVASIVRARLLAAQGELPRTPHADAGEFVVVDLRNPSGEVATLDYGAEGGPDFSIGRSATLDELSMQGLRESSEKSLAARSLNCPQCGAALELRLASAQSLSCVQCHALIDLSHGFGEQLASVAQAARPPSGQEPRIALGTTGRLAVDGTQPSDWQVVGFLVRTDIPEDGDESPTPWREYLLYHRTAGFAFLVDTSEGWSVVRPLTGAPELRSGRATWQGERYREGHTYAARVSWVEGEFYWRVERDETATVTDYAGEGAAAGRLLSRERTDAEVTWSGGRQLDAAEVARAFGLDGPQAGVRADVRPLSSGSNGMSLKTVLILLAILVVVMLLMSRCGGDDCDDVARAYGANSSEHRQCVQARSRGGRAAGGSFGGYSTGGGHK